MDLDPADVAERIALKAVTLTHVRYARGDLLGHILLWFSLLPVFIGLGGFMTHFFFRRELQAMFFGLELIVNEVVNQVLTLPPSTIRLTHARLPPKTNEH
jgi:dolichyldiphosphatase